MSPEFTQIVTQDVLMTSILMGLIALVGLVGNTIMLRTILKYPRMRSDFYIVFGSLSVADSLFLIISVPAHIMDMVQAVEITTELWCKTSNYIVSACGFVAAYLVVVLSVLRGILLTNRNTIRRPQGKHMLFVSLVLYLVAILSSIPIFTMYTSFNGFCDIVHEADQQQERWLVNSFSAFVPIVLVLLIYILTYLFGKRYFSDSYSPREKEKSRLVTSIIIAFFVCQVPYRIVDIYYAYINDEDPDTLQKMYTIKNYLMCLVMSDKAVRPVLYSKLTSDLSEAFDEVINCTCCFQHYSMTSSLDTEHAEQCLNVSSSTPEPVDGPRPGVDRTISFCSTTSENSQTPLTHSRIENVDVDIELIGI